MSNRNGVSEPINLIEWQSKTRSANSGRLFTCGRPGREEYGTERVPIPDQVITRWVEGLPAAEGLHIVSLLGTKGDGTSEFVYYPYRSAREEGD